MIAELRTVAWVRRRADDGGTYTVGYWPCRHVAYCRTTPLLGGDDVSTVAQPGDVDFCPGCLAGVTAE